MLAESWKDAVLDHSIVLDVWLQPMFSSPHLVVPPRLFLVVSRTSQPCRKVRMTTQVLMHLIPRMNLLFFQCTEFELFERQLDCVREEAMKVPLIRFIVGPAGLTEAAAFLCDLYKPMPSQALLLLRIRCMGYHEIR